MLTPPELAVIAILIGLFVLIFATPLKIELIAILVLIMLAGLGLVTPEEALSGFSSSVVITLIGLFVITTALEETGVVQWVARRLNRIGQGSEVKLIALFMLTGAVLSLIMNNVAAGAVLLPAAVGVARASRVNVSKLLMPMSFGTLVGGMATYLTTANIVMSELLLSRGFSGLNMLDFLPTGSLIVLAGLLYMVLLGRHLLPNRESLSQSFMQAPDLQSTYQLEERFWDVYIPQDSPLAYQRLIASGIGGQLGLTVAAIARGGHTITAPEASTTLKPGDTLLIVGRQERVQRLLEWGVVLLSETEHVEAQKEQLGETVEIVVAPRSSAIGKTLSQLQFREQFGLTVVALWRESRSYRTDVGQLPLRVGDALLVQGHGKADAIKALADDRNYIVPSSGYSFKAFRTHKARIAVLITLVVLVIAILDVFSLPLTMLAGAAAMVVTGCLTMDEFYDAVEWRVIFLVAGMLPLSVALINSGLADRVGVLVVQLLADYSPLVLVAGMIVLTMLVVQIIGGQITALLIGPIAIEAALQMNVSPQAMAVAVAMACSMAFLTPIAHPVNILMMGPADYKFGDFFRVGLGMTLVTLVTMLFGLALFWGVR